MDEWNKVGLMWGRCQLSTINELLGKLGVNNSDPNFSFVD